MAEKRRVAEQLLREYAVGDEVRRVVAIDGDELAVMELSHGPATEVAFGSPSHGHKMLCAREGYAHVLGVSVGEVDAELRRYFGVAGEPPMLSDLMDRFDVADEAYVYAAWSGGGDAVLRQKPASA